MSCVHKHRVQNNKRLNCSNLEPFLLHQSVYLHLWSPYICSGQNKNTIMSQPVKLPFSAVHYCKYRNTPEWAQRWVLISVSLSWVNMMMWTVINSSSYHRWAWGTGLFMAAVHTFISPGCWGFYLYGSLETKRKRYYKRKIFFLSSSPPKPTTEAKSKWNAMQMNPNGLLNVCPCIKEGFNVMPHVEHRL